jgi:hypothetical protein
MKRQSSPAAALAERLRRPQRLGVFGRRGAGKTTLLTMLYREAVGGRLPGLRLAAADARTADYLADKILQLEASQPLPATLGETELRFHLYHQNGRVELVVKDYQGEHVALGRAEPIREFLRDCDAVWLCLDAALTGERGDCLRAEQEVEQLVEDYLALEPQGEPHRPMALVLTKADLLPSAEPAPAATAVTELCDRRLNMTSHALTAHCPTQTRLAVSSLGRPLAAAEAADLKPSGLAEPLLWLLRALQAQDEARLARLWEMAGHDVELLERAVDCFARRYPDSSALRDYRRRLAALRRRRTRRRLLFGALAALALFLGVWTYDAVGYSRTERFAALNGDDPEAVKAQWLAFQAWHPTRYWFGAAARRAEAERLRDLEAQIRERHWRAELNDLRRRSAHPDADAVAVERAFRRLQADNPEFSLGQALGEWQDRLRRRAEAESARQADEAFRDLERLETKADLPDLVARADQFLKEHGDSARAEEVTRRRQSYLQRIDERDYQAAVAYSGEHPDNYHTRRERFRQYLERHPSGAWVRQSEEAIGAIETDWDKHDFRLVRDHYRAAPAQLKQLDALCLSYLAAHPRGRYRDDARNLLRWSERVATERDYRVTLLRGRFDPKAAGWFSSGLHLSVELEVNGVVYGPSTIVRKTAYPEWNYEFPRRVRWKVGDAVKIRVVDHYYWKRTIAEFHSDGGDPLALRLLSGETRLGKHSVTFASDFDMPVLPRIE